MKNPGARHSREGSQRI